MVNSMLCVISWLFKVQKNKKKDEDFPGGPAVKNPPANAGEIGLILGPGIFHIPQSN